MEILFLPYFSFPSTRSYHLTLASCPCFVAAVTATFEDPGDYFISFCSPCCPFPLIPLPFLPFTFSQLFSDSWFSIQTLEMNIQKLQEAESTDEICPWEDLSTTVIPDPSLPPGLSPRGRHGP